MPVAGPTERVSALPRSGFVEYKELSVQVKWRAAQADASAQFNLDVKYAKGEGAERDDAEAMRWFRIAADRGCKRAKEEVLRFVW